MSHAVPSPSTPPARGRFERLATGAAMLVPVCLGLLLAWHSLSDADIWFHQRAGRDLLAGDGVARTNRYSFTEPDRPWHNHETLFQLLVAPLGPATATGVAAPATDTGTETEPDVRPWNALRLLLVGLLATTLALGDGRWRTLRRRDAGVRPAATWTPLALLTGLLLLWPRLILRPELFSYLFIVVILRSLETFARRGGESASSPRGKAAWRTLVDPRTTAGRIFWLTVLWVQCHGFAALAPGLWLLAWFSSRLGATERSPHAPPAKLWLGGLALSILALALTPYGIGGLTYPLQAMGQFSNGSVDMRRVIVELVPLLETQNSLHWTLWAFRASLVWAGLWIILTWGRVPVLRVLLLVLSAAAAFLGQRNLGLYALAFCLVHSGIRPGDAPRFLRNRFPDAVRRLLTPAGAVVTLVCGLLWAGLLVTDRFYLAEGVARRFGAGLTPAHYPLDTAAALQAAGLRRVVTDLGGAGVVLDRTEAKLYIDGRTEAYPTSLWSEYGILKQGGEAARKILARRRPDGVLVTHASGALRALTQDLLQDDRWTLAALDESAYLFRPQTETAPADGSGDLLNVAANRLEDRLRSEAPTGRSPRFADRCLALGTIWKSGGHVDRQEGLLRLGLDHCPEHPTLHHNLGNILLEQGRFDSAADHFETALAINPRLAGTYQNLGVCRLRQNRPEEAVRAFGRAVRIDPERFQAWANLAAALDRLGKRSEAIRAAERALLIRPRDQRLRRWLAQRRDG